MLVHRLLAVPMLLAGLVAAAAPEPPRVAGFSAFLLNSRTGQLSADVMANADQLGNVPAGPLSAVSALVVVRIAFGAEAAVPEGARVHLVATEASVRGRAARVLLDRSARLGPVAQDGTTHVGFWLDDIGCATITLRARLASGTTKASNAAARGQAELPFTCYE
ncbi:hypothetical protein [Allosphingosinicella deserti]|uniref:Uncharacterized protein n=1 Tax=Allosphingosinicella deserti TaxID=2116704 RepID=A0A2P7QYI8_9SPHN|nr:hypothetical protein [Sphingomonas deserti]PSJ43026.1 hypothetical protein C7I55_01070 [Sphingomonas deserti]